MRILIAGQTYLPGSNGQAIFTIHLAEGLARAGHEVQVLAPAHHLGKERRELNGVRLELRPSVSMWFWHPESYYTSPFDPGVGRILDDFRPEVIHIQDHYPVAHSILGPARRRKIPLVGTNHFLPDNLMPYFPAWLPHGLVRRILWGTMLEVYNQFNLVTTPTETAAQILREQPIHVPVVAVSCGVETDRFFPVPGMDRAQVRRKYGLEEQAPLFVYVGRLDREKCVNVLVDAFARLKDTAARLVIGGKGAQLGALRAQVRRLGLEGRVTVTGFIPHADLPLLLNAADIFCMPSPQELQSIASLEAMACGLPVLAANARALPELVSDGVNGRLFAPFNPDSAAGAIRDLLGCQADWLRMGQASLAKARSHSLENTIQRYAELYTGL